MAKRASRPTDATLRELRAFGLAYPGAHTKSPKKPAAKKPAVKKRR